MAATAARARPITGSRKRERRSKSVGAHASEVVATEAALLLPQPPTGSADGFGREVRPTAPANVLAGADSPHGDLGPRLGPFDGSRLGGSRASLPGWQRSP